jgi:hypothetical protein
MRIKYRLRLPRYSSLTDGITAAMIIIKIYLTAMDLVTVTAMIPVVTAITVITIRTVRISETHALFIRNQTAVPGSIYKRNKTLKRPNLRLETLIDSVVKPVTPVTLISTLLVYTYSIWPKLKEKII